MVGVELLQGGVEMSLGWVSKNKWEGLPLLQVFGGFGEVIILYLSVKDESDANESYSDYKVYMVGIFFFYLLVFFRPFLLLLFFVLAHLLQRGRCERSQELSTNRGQQRG